MGGKGQTKEERNRKDREYIARALSDAADVFSNGGGELQRHARALRMNADILNGLCSRVEDRRDALQYAEVDAAGLVCDNIRRELGTILGLLGEFADALDSMPFETGAGTRPGARPRLDPRNPFNAHGIAIPPHLWKLSFRAIGENLSPIVKERDIAREHYERKTFDGYGWIDTLFEPLNGGRGDDGTEQEP